jgi:sugar-specific transcriptional regulator TrmB
VVTNKEKKMSLVDFLQQTGFNKYESEAYYALARHGPLTGYEVGKRSEVPLSRSYEVLERLAEKGWIHVQPGDPPRYLAIPPRELLARLRIESTKRLDGLSQSISEFEEYSLPSGFWIIKGYTAIVARIRSLLGTSQLHVDIMLPQMAKSELVSDVNSISEHITFTFAEPLERDKYACIVLIDDATALVGTLIPSGDCQAIISNEPALVASLKANFAYQPQLTLVPSGQQHNTEWLDWESRKQQRLQHEAHRSAS